MYTYDNQGYDNNITQERKPRKVDWWWEQTTQVTNLDMRGPRSRPQFLRLVNISGGLFGARIFDTLFNTIDTICGIWRFIPIVLNNMGLQIHKQPIIIRNQEYVELNCFGHPRKILLSRILYQLYWIRYQICEHQMARHRCWLSGGIAASFVVLAYPNWSPVWYALYKPPRHTSVSHVRKATGLLFGNDLSIDFSKLCGSMERSYHKSSILRTNCCMAVRVANDLSIIQYIVTYYPNCKLESMAAIPSRCHGA